MGVAVRHWRVKGQSCPEPIVVVLPESMQDPDPIPIVLAQCQQEGNVLPINDSNAAIVEDVAPDIVPLSPPTIENVMNHFHAGKAPIVNQPGSINDVTWNQLIIQK